MALNGRCLLEFMPCVIRSLWVWAGPSNSPLTQQKWWAGLASWACDLTTQGPALGLRFCCHDTTWNFIFELFSEVQWHNGVCISWRDRINLCVCLLLWPPHSHKCSRCPMSTGIRETRGSWEFIKTQSKYRATLTVELIGALRVWQDVLSFQIRTCLISWTYCKFVYILWPLGRP